ncbi:MAG: YbaK/EbsC family protein [Bacillota bacterium]|nr:YbaK/EbsC family protein [Bacillota bacterium]
MSVENVKAYLSQWGADKKVMEFEASSATVELAAEAVGTEPARIAKTLSFAMEDGCILVVTAGDMKIDNKKFKTYFGVKAKMLSLDVVESLTGHPVGGVCPFAVKDGVKIYLDESMKRFDMIYPAAGSPNSAVKLTCDELMEYSRAEAWVDVCKS